MTSLRSLCSDKDSERIKFIENHVRDMFQHVAPLQYYVPHDLEHFKRVEEKLDELIPDDNKEQITPKEWFYLLCSVWLHDVGLLERPQGMSSVEVRKQHHFLSRDYIRCNMKQLRLDPFEANFIGDLALWHRRSIDIDEHARVYQGFVANEAIRCDLLGALLRLADGLDVSYQRAYEPW